MELIYLKILKENVDKRPIHFNCLQNIFDYYHFHLKRTICKLFSLVIMNLLIFILIIYPALLIIYIHFNLFQLISFFKFDFLNTIQLLENLIL